MIAERIVLLRGEPDFSPTGLADAATRSTSPAIRSST